MLNCEVVFKKNGLISLLHPATKQLIVNDICERLNLLTEEMKKYPKGKILATYEDEHLVLELSGYPAELAARMEHAIRNSSPRPLSSPFDIDEIRKN